MRVKRAQPWEEKAESNRLCIEDRLSISQIEAVRRPCGCMCGFGGIRRANLKIGKSERCVE
jgi:hypothetical protein